MTNTAQSAESVAHSADNFFGTNLHQLKVPTEHLFDFFGFPVTNTVTTAILGIICVLLFIVWVRGFSVFRPSRAQLFVETIVMFFANFLANIAGDKKKAKDIVPITGALAVFLLLHNLLFILLPFLGAIMWGEGEHKTHLFRVLTSDLNLALGLSVGMFVVAQVYGFQKIGIPKVLSKYIQIEPVIKGFQQSPGKGGEGIILFAVGLLEIISTLARILSLCLRLFGNIFAGEILLIVALNAFGLVLPSVVLLFGLVVGIIQALVFASLTATNLAEASTAQH